MKHELLEQYKLYVEMADRVSQRRLSTNRFYISLLSALCGLHLLVKEVLEAEPNKILYSLIIFIISLLWWFNINSYRQLNSGKFKVIHEMEQELPFRCYDREWEHLGWGRKSKLYYQLSKVESHVPFIIAISSIIYLIISCLVE